MSIAHAGVRTVRGAVTPHVKAQDAVGVDQGRQPAGEDVLIGADAVVHHDRLGRRDPGRGKVDQRPRQRASRHLRAFGCHVSSICCPLAQSVRCPGVAMLYYSVGRESGGTVDAVDSKKWFADHAAGCRSDVKRGLSLEG